MNSSHEVATREVLERMLAESLALEEMAARLKLHVDSVRRALRRHELIAPSRQLVSEEVRRRVLQLGAEGMVANWIAEDVKLHVSTVHRILGPRPEDVQEWQSVWLQIRRDEELYWLHTSIAPTAGRESFVYLREHSDGIVDQSGTAAEGVREGALVRA